MHPFGELDFFHECRRDRRRRHVAWSLGRAEAVEPLADAEAIARKLDAPIWLAAALAAQCELYDDRSRATQALAIVERLGDTAIGTRARALLERT